MASLTKKLMHALQYDRYGGGAAALKHVEVAVPTPNKNEVLVKSEAITLNPFDMRIQKGVARPIFLPRKFPHIPGTDVAGEIVEIGPGVTKFKAGDKVVATVPYTVFSRNSIEDSWRFLCRLLVQAVVADGVQLGRSEGFRI